MVLKRFRAGYQHVAQGEGGAEEEGEKFQDDPFTERISRLSWRVKGIAIAVICVLLFAMGFSSPTASDLVPPPPEVVPDANYLHVLVRASKPDVHLCKTLVSAAALDYPVPSIITWNVTFDDSFAADGGSHLARMSGVASYLKMIRELGSERTNDVVLIVDGYDTWFQLRPDVLMERFFEMNRNANNRVVRRFGQSAMDAGGISQRIVFGAQKDCSREADDPACYAVPESPISKGKGPGRFLNSAVVMGELGSMQKLVDKAQALMRADKQKATEQDVFSRIFGEQEYQREVIRERYMGTWAGIYHRFMKTLSFERTGILGPHPTHRKIEASGGGESEFNIGLDYEGLLGHSTVADELDFLVLNDTKAVSKVLQHKAASSRARFTIPDDIQRSLKPFWTRNPDPALPKGLSWKELPLYTNLWTGKIPATIHHTSPRADAQSLRTTAWDQLWTQPYARALLDLHVNEPYRAFAILRADGYETAWWPMHQQKWRIRNHGDSDKKKEWIPWGSICFNSTAEEVFRDSKGGWKAPRTEY